MEETSKVQSPCLLTVLFDGIYIGDPEDLLNYRKDSQAKIWYPTKGLGEKVDGIEFI